MPEELDLSLNQDEAASLYLIIETAIDSLEKKRGILESIKALPKDQRPDDLKEDETLDGVIRLNKALILQAKEFCVEVGQIIVELEKPEPTILPPPKHWAKD